MSQDAPIVVVGAGLAGLTAARHLREHGAEVLVFEASPNIAGLCRSEFDEEGFTYDCGAHFINSRLAAALGISDRCVPMPRYEEEFWLRGKGYGYPTGLLRSPRFVASAARGRAAALFQRPARTVGEEFRRSMGRAIADDIALPLVEAWSGASRDELSPAVAAKFSTSPLDALRLGVASRLSRNTIAIGYSHEAPESPYVHFVYPDGGIGGVCERLAEQLRDVIATESRVQQIHVRGQRVAGVTVNGDFVPARAVVNTAPLSILAKLVEGTEKLKPLERFRYRPMLFVNLKINLPKVMRSVITWTPGPEFTFFRISDIGRALPWLVPPGKNQITCDIGCEVGDENWNADPEQLALRCLAEVERLAPGVSQHYLGFHQRRTPFAYPVYLNEYEAQRRQWDHGTGVQGLVSVGRNGEFKHILMEDVYWRTRRRCRELLAAV